MLDQLKDDLPHLAAIFDSPFVQDGFCHGTELQKRQLAKSLKELMAANVGGSILLLGDKFSKGLIQGASDKIVGRCGKTGILLPNSFHNLGQGKMAHDKIMIEGGCFVYGLREVMPKRGQSEDCACPQNEDSLATAQGPRVHAQMQFTIRPGTMTILSIFFPPVQSGSSAWFRTTASISSLVARGEIFNFPRTLLFT